MTVAKSIKLMKIWMYVLGILLILIMTGFLIYSTGYTDTIDANGRKIVAVVGILIVSLLSYFCGAAVAIRAILEQQVKRNILTMEQILPK